MFTRITALPLAATAVLCLAQAGNATAAVVNDEILATGISLSSNVPAPNPDPSAFAVYNSLPAQDIYGNAFTCSSCSSKVLLNDAGRNFNFYDDYIFSVGPATVDSVSSTISLNNSLALNNLEMRLYTFDGTTLLPVTGNSPPGLKSGSAGVGGWSTPLDFSAGPESGEVSVLHNVMLTSGTYVLEVRGDVMGSSGGSYSGTLNLTPVPIPAALPLMLSGLGLLGGAARKRFARS
jgi:hypothetical protein